MQKYPSAIPLSSVIPNIESTPRMRTYREIAAELSEERLREIRSNAEACWERATKGSKTYLETKEKGIQYLVCSQDWRIRLSNKQNSRRD